MTTIKDKLHFKYNGKSTSEFGVWSVTLDGGMFEETLVASQNIREESLVDRRVSIFSGLEKEPISFELVLAFENGFTDKLIEDVVEWLYGTEYYSKLEFEDSDKVYYCMPNGQSTITHTGQQEGYITLEMRTNSPFVFGKMESKTGTTQITIDRKGKIDPESIIKIKSKSNGSTKLKMNDYTVQINNLLKDEIVTIYPSEEDIESDRDNVYHYNDYIGDLSKLGLIDKTNILSITGDVEVEYSYQPYYNK